LQEVIEGPLHEVGIEVSPLLTQTILNEFSDDPDRLALLQHTLNRTFHEYRKDNYGEVNVQHYYSIGGIADALERHAESLYSSLSFRERRAAERVFRCLTQIEYGRSLRRPMRMAAISQIAGANDREMMAAVRAVIELYAARENSLLICWSPNLTEDSVVDISHEVLITKWTRLKKWAEAEAEAVRLYRAAAQDARDDGGGQARWRGGRLSEALELLALGTWTEAWASARAEALSFATVRSFIDRQRQEGEKERKATEPETNFYSCFISYSSRDEEFAQLLCRDLEKHGVRCWFAPHNIEGGKKLYDQIDQAIRTCDRLLLVLSRHSLNSEWVRTEIAHARKKELEEGRHVLFPIRLVSFESLREWKYFDADIGKDSAREIREYFIPDFSTWVDPEAYERALQRLVGSLRK
jgi:hypothetical protein